MKLKGNISILVIFVLLASSLLGVLAMNFVQSMMKQSATIFNSYQSYYLAKAGIELGLSELGHRGIGFEQTFTDSGFVAGNFSCAGRNVPCTMWFGLSGTSTNLSQQFRSDGSTEDSVASCQSPFVLSGGSSLIVPVFRDNTKYGLIDTFLSGITYDNLYGALKSVTVITDSSQDVTFGMIILSGEELASNGIFFQTGNLQGELQGFLTSFYSFQSLGSASLSELDIFPYRFFFMISNTSSDTISFCLTSEEALPTQQYYLKSRGAYDQQQLGLEAIYQQPIPDFLLNGYLNYR